MKSRQALRALFVLVGIVFLITTAGFFFRLSWATSLWPWTDGRLSYIFLSSITAAIAAPIIWIGLTGEFGAARGGAVNLGIVALGTSVYLFVLYGREGESQLLVSAIATTFFIALNIGIFIWSNQQAIQDDRPIPRLVTISFGVFSAVLLLVSALLVFRAPVVFPWPLRPESSMIFGLIFLGAASYFLIAMVSSQWHSAKGQLIGFLAYDLVLIGPFLAHLKTVDPAHRLSLVLYLAVLTYSGAIAIYYLFIDERTRSWTIGK